MNRCRDRIDKLLSNFNPRTSFVLHHRRRPNFTAEDYGDDIDMKVRLFATYNARRIHFKCKWTVLISITRVDVWRKRALQPTCEDAIIPKSGGMCNKPSWAGWKLILFKYFQDGEQSKWEQPFRSAIFLVKRYCKLTCGMSYQHNAIQCFQFVRNFNCGSIVYKLYLKEWAIIQ